ncbi:MAG: aldo/keto reductase, partial [Lachnospiraceae bacterium]|nr:aldo/keto reductase [Lachnospiraceae bacterium]
TYQNGQYVRTRDLNNVRPAFEDLLKRLRTDYIDLGMIHYIDSMEDWNNAMNGEYIDYVHRLHEEGTIRHIGLSTHNPVIGKLAVEAGFIEMILFSINPAFDMRPATEELESMFGGYDEDKLSGIDPERARFYQMCEEENIGLTVMKGFFGGALLDKDRSPFGVAFTPAQLIHYALTRPGVSSILCGYDTKEQVDAAVSYEDASDDEKDYASVIANAPLHSYMGQCTYCGHCKPCPRDIDIAMVNKFYDLATVQDKVPQSVTEHYKALEHTAAECIGCKSCESRCPFGVKIADRMVKASALFEG